MLIIIFLRYYRNFVDFLNPTMQVHTFGAEQIELIQRFVQIGLHNDDCPSKLVKRYPLQHTIFLSIT